MLGVNAGVKLTPHNITPHQVYCQIHWIPPCHRHHHNQITLQIISYGASHSNPCSLVWSQIQLNMMRNHHIYLQDIYIFTSIGHETLGTLQHHPMHSMRIAIANDLLSNVTTNWLQKPHDLLPNTTNSRQVMMHSSWCSSDLNRCSGDLKYVCIL